MSRAPLPLRDGLGPSRVRLPDEGTWQTILEHLVDRFPADEQRLREKVAAGEVVDESGRPIGTDTAFRPRSAVFLHRDPPVETRIPFEIEILYRDDDIVVVDKPHFLATMPRGGFVAESVLVRLRREWDLPDASPAHRLDRLTAGVLLFTVRPAVRGAYQQLFEQRRTDKTYEAIARHDPDLTLPAGVRSHIVKTPGTLQAFEVDREPNSESLIERLDVRGEFARYRLTPRTGKTHQLRVHMNSLGIALHGDPLYPRIDDVAPDDYSCPLRLLSRSLSFTDPLSGRRREFTSTRTLAWPDEEPGRTRR
ncbi:pseudouridine synthase [Rhodococcus triatomae]|uniref:RNA pseudouridylate synthase n=1 Tax=Rhodococcus triatomae TaxID=300028 RepID=A0A1G8AZM9_9NOCA|nr:pseudouridine synthase [Rhodococcus triatomae]QNG17629.1 pseudouridine synthase [Rhodococcus triatomae]QNG22704.1 pseudouridine synthase [Rhodococcus triatomae]SDH26345.1 tRNA pseudouridine32 synthase / 23S rRNA pseudouridine746 synthase [Rhodococcus triatomae]